MDTPEWKRHYRIDNHSVFTRPGKTQVFLGGVLAGSVKNVLFVFLSYFQTRKINKGSKNEKVLLNYGLKKALEEALPLPQKPKHTGDC